MLFILLGLGCLALAGLRTWSYLKYRKRRRSRKNQKLDILTVCLYAAAALFLLLALLTTMGGEHPTPTEDTPGTGQQQNGTTDPTTEPSADPSNPTNGTTEPTEPQFGWGEDDGGIYYLKEDGTRATGWLDLDGKRYYLNETGYTLSGWQEVEGLQRYFRKDGSMARGEEEIDGKTYFFTSTGVQVNLVNPWHAVPENYEVELLDLSVIYATEGIRVDVRIYDALIEMMDDCNEQSGSRCCVTSGYRTMEDQEGLFSNKVNNLMAIGYSQEEAEAEASTEVAIPGTSEHQIGLAVDIVDTQSWELEEFQDDLPAQQWLMEHCWEYGFILRYPNGKTDVTGIIYEPWHYRYVGKELAKEITDLGLTLEEYLDSLD